jgi:hypothetical protein
MRRIRTQPTHKSKWSLDEDEKLAHAVALYGVDSWLRVADSVPGRTGKQCRERWMGQLSPYVVKSKWTPEEDRQLLQGHALHGNRWAEIAALLPGRSPITVKNRWSWMLRHRGTSDLQPVTTDPEMPANVPNQQAKPFEPLNVDTGLFGLPFRQFQAEMLRASPFMQ